MQSQGHSILFTSHPSTSQPESKETRNFLFFCFTLFLIRGYCFAILCWFLPNISMNEPQVCIHCPLPLEPPSHLHAITPLGCQSPGLSSLHQTANSHWLPGLHVVTYVPPRCSLSSSHPLLPQLPPFFKPLFNLLMIILTL